MSPCKLVIIVKQRYFFEPEDGDNKLLRKFGKDLPIVIASFTRRHEFSSISFVSNSDLAFSSHFLLE